ncbi:MAG: carbohydrate ABC transporter permease [Phycisphaerae bacterium]|nr:carbohydrate ABC transporter permease [Phycisphaerae bacterium]
MNNLKSNNNSVNKGALAQKLFMYIALAIFVLVVIIPFYWLMKASVSTPEQLVEIPPLLFPKPVLDNFQTLATQLPLTQYLLNSIIFSGVTALATVFCCFLAAYAFARIPCPGSSFLLWALVITMALPEIATIIPLYRMLGAMHLLDSLTGLIFVMTSVLTPFTVWVFIPFIKQIPISIEEAAVVDGANLWTILWRIYLPVMTPAIVTMMIINFVNAWNNLLYPLTFSVTAKSKCMSVAITEVFQTEVPWGQPWHLVSALGVVMVIPVLVLILSSQRAVVRGLTHGAVK